MTLIARRSEIRHNPAQSESLEKFIQPMKDANNEDSDDDDYKTLRDVANIQFDFDDVPVRKASLENDDGEETHATLTREQIADSLTSNADPTSSETADHQYNVTLSRQFRDIDS